MGNAFTALGGDLGGITINPAGSAVAPYSQVTLSPGLNISVSTTQGQPYKDQPLSYFQRRMRNTNTTFTMPNLGFSLNWDTYASRGLKSFTFSFLSNQTQIYNERTYANGTNNRTSFMGSLAENAHLDGFLGGDLGNNDSWDGAPWNYVAAMQGWLIAPFGPGKEGEGDLFMGSTEQQLKGNNKVIPGELDQYFGRERFGYKNDYTFNFGLNFNDRVWAGVNLNINSLEFNSLEYIKEAAVDPNDFGLEYQENLPDGTPGPLIQDYFIEGKLTNTLRTYGMGFSAKFGVIWNAWKGLRVGAAIQTPTWNKLTDEWTTDAISYFDKGKHQAESPRGKYSYRFREPMRANFGLAYVFGSRGLISVDYELAAYDQMKFSAYDAFSEEFNYTNEDIKEFTGIGHSLRIGGEVKVLPSLALRAGYNFLTPGEYGFNESGRKTELKAYTHDIGFGIGYSSKKSFFADLGCKGTFYNTEYILPYRDYVYMKDTETGDYIYDADGYLIPDENFMVPEIKNVRSNWKVVLTLGWRF